MDRTALWLSLILVMTLGLFTPSLLNGYTYDDPHYARTVTPNGERNPLVAELMPFGEYWSKPMNWGLLTNCRSYRPVTVYSYALVNEHVPPVDSDGEDNAWAQHAVNLVLHGLATLLVFLLASPLTGRRPALLAALVFGVHAIHSGAIASIVGRAELLAFGFGAAAAALYGRGLAPPWRCRGRLGFVGRGLPWLAIPLLLMLSLGAKESAVAWTVIIPLLAWAGGSGLRSQLWPAVITLGLPLAAYLTLREHTLIEHVYPRGPFQVAYDANPLFYLPFVERLLNATIILAAGLGKVLLPINLSSNYGDGAFVIVSSVFHWRFLFASLLFTVILVGAWRLRHRHPTVSLAAAAFFAFTFVTSNIPIPIETNFAERTYYAAVFALALLTAWLGQHLPQFYRVAFTTVIVAWTLLNAATDLERVAAWHDNATLFSADLDHQPNSVGLHIDMADIHRRHSDSTSALAEYRYALAINPQSPRALTALAEHLTAANTNTQAEALLRRALASPLLVNGTADRRVHFAFGKLHALAGHPDAARRSFETALACNPYLPGIRLHLLRDATRRRDATAMRRYLTEGRRLLPDYAPFEMYRGVLLQLESRHRAAATILAEVLPRLAAQDDTAEGWLVFAKALLHLGQTAQARQIAARFARQVAKFPAIKQRCREILRETATPAPGR